MADDMEGRMQRPPRCPRIAVALDLLGIFFWVTLSIRVRNVDRDLFKSIGCRWPEDPSRTRLAVGLLGIFLNPSV
jgi:hypothetical protein